MAYFNDTFKKFEEYFNGFEGLYEFCAECDFPCNEDTCDGFCPECGQMLKCEAYKEIKEDWEWFYT